MFADCDTKSESFVIFDKRKERMCWQCEVGEDDCSKGIERAERGDN